MDKIPQRNKLAKLSREMLEKYENSLIFPVKDPNFYQILSVFLSAVFLFKPQPILAICLITIILISDWLDGAVARRYKLTSKEGWLIDVVVDRISEGLMFVAYLGTFIGNLFFGLYLLNFIGAIYSIKSGKQRLIALRFLYLIYLIVVVLS